MAIIIANNDVYEVPIAATGGLYTIGSARGNDEQDGGDVVLGQFKWVFDTSAFPGEGTSPNYRFVFNAYNGNVLYGSGVPTGTYVFPYEIVAVGATPIDEGSSPNGTVTITVYEEGGEGGEGGEETPCPGIAYFSRTIPACSS